MNLAPHIAEKRTLEQRFADRKRETLQALADCVQARSLNGLEVAELKEKLHKLAGVAGMFGEAELGRHAAALETILVSWMARTDNCEAGISGYGPVDLKELRDFDARVAAILAFHCGAQDFQAT